MEVFLNEIVEFSNVSLGQEFVPETVDKICKLPIQEIFKLHAERVAWCDYPFYEQIACEWIQVANGKCTGDYRLDDIFYSCRFISKCIAEKLSDLKMEGDLYVCTAIPASLFSPVSK